MTQPDLIQFLTDRPAINLSKFGRECGITSTLMHYIAQGKRSLQPEQAERILPIAKKYGYPCMHS
jgi:hypothetical protein